MKVNFHIHSCFSDGTFTPLEIAKKAKSLRFDAIALTDHNTISGIPDFLSACDEVGIQGFPGIEISTNYLGKEVHLLGFFTPKSELFIRNGQDLIDFTKGYYEIKTKQNRDIVERIHERFQDVSWEDFLKFCEKKGYSENKNRVHIANYLVYKKMAVSVVDAFNKFLDKSCEFYVEKKNIIFEDAVELIKSVGGITCVAHMGEYKFEERDMEEFIHVCNEIHVDAFELFHPSHSQEFAYALMEKVRKENRFFMFSMGSDFHNGGCFKKFDLFSSDGMTSSSLKVAENIVLPFSLFLKERIG